MKALIIFALLAVSTVTFAQETIKAEKEDSRSTILDLVVGVKQTYSQTSGLEAKVVELLAGDGMNAERMVLVLNTGYGDTKIFELSTMMVEVTRITFLDKDLIVINYTQDDFDQAGDSIQVNRSITIKVGRNADNTLSDTITVTP
ncbi:MAG: hypothetical protein H7177_00345 [Rhizobacter sp.]|nr:hypothetical protein [Bacteriovorax sp.]